MKKYVEYVFRKEKKPIDIEKLYLKIEALIQAEKENYVLTNEDKSLIDSVVEAGVENYEFYRTPNDRYTLLSKTSFRKGRFFGNRAGEGFVICVTSYVNREGKQVVNEDKYTITKDDCHGAIDGDEVLIDIGGNGRKPSIQTIIDRRIENITGEVYRIGSSYFVKPLDKRKQYLNIALDGEHVEGQIVSVALTGTFDNNFYKGNVVREFKHKNDPREDILLEAFKCGMPEGFSDESIKQAESIPMSVSSDDVKGRYDFTSWEVFSIDGKDTKDKDDAISLIKLHNGNVLLGVHIADVPYYVPKASPIDRDAFTKGTSYYFGGCVEPQLPHKLSNGICSLNDNVLRLTKSILIEFDSSGKVVSRSLVPGVINSRIGMNYDDVNKILKDGEVVPGYEPYVETLKEMERLAKKLRKRRKSDGAIEFSRPELKFIHDEDGNVVGIDYRYQDVSENLIEEFMLAANVNVGEILTDAGFPCVYRIHDVPNGERLEEFLRLLDVLGIPFEFNANDICEDKHLLQVLTKHINDKGGRLSPMLNTNLIRCMSHACYSTKNIGHYGTGFDLYTHFTSPIRRLADLTLSRIIDECYFESDEKIKERNRKRWNVDAYEYAQQASKMERVEEEVEKQVNLMETAEYLSQFVGEEFEGTISSLSNNGITICLDNMLEGRVRTRSLNGDYIYNPETFTLLSINGGDNYYIGDRVKVRLEVASKENKTVEFSILEKIHENNIPDKDKSNQYVKDKAKDDKIRKSYKK